MTTAPPSLSAPRADALDALRGLSILAMALSGMIPFGVLPAWMYHAQVPPPNHVFDPTLPGITWVDLVFPFFLFSMGAAMPLALARRIAAGDRWWQLAGYVLKRGFLLAAFAIYDRHIRPSALSPHPDARVFLTSLLGFTLLFPALARLPAAWSASLRLCVRLLGWGGAVALLAGLEYPDGSGFLRTRSDIIIIVLANTAVFGSAVWLLTRTQPLVRVGIMGVLLAIRLAHNEPGWVQTIWNWSPAPWIYKLYYLQYLLIVIPGTLAGDRILRWMGNGKSRGLQPARTCDTDLFRRSAGAGEILDTPASESRTSQETVVLALGLVCILTTAVVVIGLYARWLPWTTIIAAALCVIGAVLPRVPLLSSRARVPLLSSSGSGAMDRDRATNHCLRAVAHDSTHRLIHDLYLWGVAWLLLGLVFEPYEGGIKKDHPTVSYYFVTCGLALFVMVALHVWIAHVRRGPVIRLLIANGQNPMIAYSGINSLIPPMLGLTGIDALLLHLTPDPWPGVGRAAFRVLLLALAVAWCTRRRIVWRT